MLVSKWKKEKWGGITFRGPLSAYQTFCKALVNPTSLLSLTPPHPPPRARLAHFQKPVTVIEFDATAAMWGKCKKKQKNICGAK